MKFIIHFFLFLSMTALQAQTIIEGKVVDNANQPVVGATITIEGTSKGTITDFNGIFSLEIKQNFPFYLRVSSVGYEAKRVSIDNNQQELLIQLQQGTSLDEIVVSASRNPERIFESPVTVERFGIKDIASTPSASFYGGLENLKGVDINTNSLTFQSVNTRGFADFANTRFVQLVDGMDNSSPALNFVLGNLLGVSELDVQSVELLPGASSALYGANAFNGILFMQSKNPFDFPGISAYYKNGITSQEAAGDNYFYDVGVRVAHKFSEKFAAKANFSYLKGTDWYAVSEVDVLSPGKTRQDPNYDGLNIYGDEVSTNIRGVGQTLANMGAIPEAAVQLLPNADVSRTGYSEQYLANYDAKSLKFDAALHYRPFADDFEIIYLGKFGQGTTIYQGSNRYSLNDFFLQQHKLEVKNDNFFVRAYITDEDAGDSYDTRFTAININRDWKSDQQWFGEYAGAFVQASLQGVDAGQAHALARQTADTGRLIPGTPEFETAFNKVISNPDLAEGSQFKDGSQLRHIEGNYNFAHITQDVVDVQVGGSYRQYRLNSFGTIFTDNDGAITYNEYGIYTQLQKSLLDNRLKFTGSLRYDESELFDGNFSPRLSAAYTAGANRNHNFRASFQTGFRYPTTQNLFIGLDAGRAILVGSSERNLDRYVREFTLSGAGAQATGSPTASVGAREAYRNSFSISSVNAGAPASADVSLVEPEKISAFEVGYRGNLGKVTVDLNAYYNSYEDFISNEIVLVPFYGEVGDNALSLLALQQGDFQPFQVYTNSPADIDSYGGSIGLNTRVFNGFDLGGSYTYAKEDFDKSSAPDFRTGFNTPEHKVKLSLGHSQLFENFGFKLNYRWSDTYYWQSTFADGKIPAYSVMDAQVNYTLDVINSVIKLGASNLFGNEYYTAFGTGHIGSQYYLSLRFNGF